MHQTVISADSHVAGNGDAFAEIDPRRLIGIGMSAVRSVAEAVEDLRAIEAEQCGLDV